MTDKEQNKVIANELDEYIQKLSNSEFEKLLQDDYFKGLNVNQILELAKKSIRLTAENRKLEEGMEDLNTELESLREQYHAVLNLAKQNADANEYCIQELESENENLLKLADLEMDFESLKQYYDATVKCLEINEWLNKALREENQKLKYKIELYENARKEK